MNGDGEQWCSTAKLLNDNINLANIYCLVGNPLLLIQCR